MAGMDYFLSLASPAMCGASWWPLIVAYIVTFLVCGIPFGKIFARMLGKIDLQKVGSGNIGTTNALRAGGPKVAVPTLICDVLKGVLGVNVIRLVVANMVNIDPADVLAINGGAGIGDTLLAIAGLVCLCGHIFSPYLHFKGGKGIATGVGVLFGLSWPFALLHLGIFIAVVALTRIVSLGSIVTVLALPITVPLYFSGDSLSFKVIMSLLGLLVVWAHRSNVKKLLNGTESKLSFTKRVKEMDE